MADNTAIHPSSVPSILEIRSLQKSFGSNNVLKDISLSVEPGNVVSVIGPSGSGKSTLLRCATFLETADGGDILYDGQYALHDGVYASKTELGRFRTLFGLVFQNFNLFPHYSVMKNITEAPLLHGQDKEEVMERAGELLKKMGLEGKEKAYPCELSGGQQQRVLLARALCATQKVLLLDEPVSGLDPVVTAEMYRLIGRLNREGITVIMISHDIAAAVQYAGKLLHMGSRTFFGTREEYIASDIGRQFLESEGGENDA